MSLTIPPLLKYYTKRFNRLGQLGLAFIVLGLLTLTFDLQYLQRKTQSLESSLTERSVRSKNFQQTPAANRHAMTDSTRFLQKEAFFNILEFIQNKAVQNDVGYESINYQSSDMNEVGLIKYELDLPFSATYVDLKKFLYAIMQPYPNTVVLANISLYRNNVQEDKLDGSMQIALYFRK